MRQQVLGWVVLALMLFLVMTACAAFEDPSQKATENAQSTALWTRVHALETQESTLEAIRSTADGASVLATRVVQAEQQVAALRSTNQALLSNPSATPYVNVRSTAVGGGVPAGAGPSPLPQTSGARFVQPTTTTQKDDAGCAIGSQSSFTLETTEIYFIAQAIDLESGISFSMRVSSGGNVLTSDNDFWTSDQEYDETCIWYLIDQDTIAFEPGTYTVEFLANEVMAAQTTFVITDSQ